jgi:hypothetical protein
MMTADVSSLPGVAFDFDVADLTEGLPEADRSVDLTVCLYSVLNHLPAGALPSVVGEIARITGGEFTTTVRSIGSTPTVAVASVEQARHLNFDHLHDRCHIEFRNGYRTTFTFHLFGAAELRSGFNDYFSIEDQYGLDIFHSRFMPDRRWNPASTFIDKESLGVLRSWRRAMQEPAISLTVACICCCWGIAVMRRRKCGRWEEFDLDQGIIDDRRRIVME